MTTTISEQLTNYLSDAHAIEEQALAQLRSAPEIAGTGELAALFRAHLAETEQQEQRVHDRMVELGSSPSAIKDRLMALGGKAFVLFARVQPDTPGKLVTHAYSYEHLEVASYAMLEHVAERAGDDVTARLAQEIGGQERRMGERLRAEFDGSVNASLLAAGNGAGGDTIPSYLADAHAIEHQAIEMLERAIGMTNDTELQSLFEQHLAESRTHLSRVEQRIEQLSSSPSLIKDAAMRLGALNWAGFFHAQPDTPGKLVTFLYAFEHLEIGGYLHLRGVAERGSDDETARLATELCGEEERAAGLLEAQFGHAADLSLEMVGAAA